MEENACGSCSELMDLPKSTLVDRFGAADNVPCDRVGPKGQRTQQAAEAAAAPAAPLPLSPSTSPNRRTRRRPRIGPSYKENVLCSGPDALGYEAGPAAYVSSQFGAKGQRSKMNAEMQSTRPRKSERTKKIEAASILAGRPVAVSRGGTSKSALNKRRRDIEDVAAGVAEALNPNNVEEGLAMVASGARTKKAKVRAEEAKEAKEAEKKRRAEAAAAAAADATAATAAEGAADHQAWVSLRAMREADGSRTFSVGQAGSVKALGDGAVCPGCGLNPCTGCRGKLIPVESVKAYFSTLAQKRKKEAVRTKKRVLEDDDASADGIDDAAAAADTSTGTGGGKKAAGKKKKKTVTKKATTAKTKKKPAGKKKK